jgi:hypothetical protein
MPETILQPTVPASPLLEEETRKYLDSNPSAAAQLQRAQKVYQTFGRYLNLTQSRTIVRESGGSTAEAELNGTILRTDF